MLLPKCEGRVISLKSIETNEKAMEQLYAAAASVFLLPDYGQVLAYLNGGPLPDLPDHLRDTSFSGYHVGLMAYLRGKYVRVVTNMGREVIVGPCWDHRGVTVNFRTSVKEASVRAAYDVLQYLHQHTEGNVCWVKYEGIYWYDVDKDIILNDGKVFVPDWDRYHQRQSS